MASPPIPRWLPNAISCVRVALVPVWVVFAEQANRAAHDGGDANGPRLLAALSLVVIGASDVLDGWLARRYGLQSPLGANLDALADKLAQVVLTTYLSLRVGAAFGWIPYWFLLLLIARDALLVVGFVAIKRRRGRVEAEHEWHGKASSLCLFAVLLAVSFGVSGAALTTTLAATAALVVFSTLRYTQHGWRQFTAG